MAVYSCVTHNDFIEQDYVLHKLLQKLCGPIWICFAIEKAEVGKDFAKLWKSAANLCCQL